MKKSKIGVDKNDSFSGPLDLDFSVFDTLLIELYKTRTIPSSDQRHFVHNVSSQWKRVCKLDIGRVEKIEGTSIYHVSKAKSKDIVFLSVDLLYHFNVFLEQREKFKFGDKNDFKVKALSVFAKYKIKNTDFVDKIAKEAAH
ncbi:hypothetical protein ACU5DF_02450 [Aliivibrio wodanis]|uniref:hypothetical protein n=1 Tax=Aliivibrio wodanis TaxID=80852 RepID=UPI00406D4A61